MLLAYSIAFSLAFSIAVINFYENYLHDVTSYTLPKCAMVECFGLTSFFFQPSLPSCWSKPPISINSSSNAAPRDRVILNEEDSAILL